MDNARPPKPPELNVTENIIYIQFFNKKNFPPGEWSREPDYCEWEYFGYKCVAIRDMSLGVWNGYVGLTKEHPAFNKPLVEIFNEKWALHVLVHGGICFAGKLPMKFQNLNRKHWWLGFECSQGEDIMPLIEMDKTDPLYEASQDSSTYKDLLFVRREVHGLVNQLIHLKAIWEQQVL